MFLRFSSLRCARNVDSNHYSDRQFRRSPHECGSVNPQPFTFPHPRAGAIAACRTATGRRRPCGDARRHRAATADGDPRRAANRRSRARRAWRIHQGTMRILRPTSSGSPVRGSRTRRQMVPSQARRLARAGVTSPTQFRPSTKFWVRPPPSQTKSPRAPAARARPAAAAQALRAGGTTCLIDFTITAPSLAATRVVGHSYRFRRALY